MGYDFVVVVVEKFASFKGCVCVYIDLMWENSLQAFWIELGIC